jgi:hypothetical protein
VSTRAALIFIAASLAGVAAAVIAIACGMAAGNCEDER